MKKRVKLLTTIASLCLAVALMAFGVYAASTHTVAITSNVSFQVSDVYVNITGTVKQGADVASATEVGGKGYSETSYTDGTPMVPKEAAALAAWSIGDVEFTSTNDTIVYVLEVENVSADNSDVKVKLSATLKTDIDGTTAEVVSVTNDGANITNDFAVNEDITVASGKTLVITLAITLTDKTVELSSTPVWDATLTCAR